MSDPDSSFASFQLVGFKCSLLNEPEKHLEIIRGDFLVPSPHDKSLLIDRYDCRGYLQDISGYDANHIIRRSDPQTDEDVALEQMCDYERYLEMQMDIHELATLQEEVFKRQEEDWRSSYSAVGFAYADGNDVSQSDPTFISNIESEKALGMKNDGQARESDKSVDDKPYTCPPELVLPTYMVLPQLDRQAAIIERTAVFIARSGAQMEILLKAKQSTNPQFSFLNYESELNAFYKELVKLIKAGRYIPKRRQALEANILGSDGQLNTSQNQSVNDDYYELKLPKVDISNTAYASLINRFKKSNAEKLASSSPSSVAAESSKSGSPSPPPTPPATEQTTSPLIADSKESSADASKALPSMVDYEQCYQDYYKHYYAYYYVQLARIRSSAPSIGASSTDMTADESAQLIQDAAKAAAAAASAAVNTVHQSRLAGTDSSKSISLGSAPPTNEQRAIIDKMAEYVARNGEEFEDVVKKQKSGDPRLAFLRPGHIFHEYYQSKKAEITGKKTVEPQVVSNKVANDSLMKKESEKRLKKASISKKTTMPSSFPCDRHPKVDNINTSVAPCKIPPPKGSISFRLSKSASSSRLKGSESIESPVLSPAAIPEDIASSVIRVSASCSLLPDYSSSSEDESEKDVSPTPSPVEQRVEHEALLLVPEMTDQVIVNQPPSASIYGPHPLLSAPSTSNVTTFHANSGTCLEGLSRSIEYPGASPLDVVSDPGPTLADQVSPTNGAQLVQMSKEPRQPMMTKSPCSSTLPLKRPRFSVSPIREVNPSQLCLTHLPVSQFPETTASTSPRRTPSPPKSQTDTTTSLTESASLSALVAEVIGTDSVGCEHSKLQMERRQRAALLVARLQRSKAVSKVKTAIGNTEELLRASPPPPPNSVPNAVARDVVAQLKLQREKVMVAKATEDAKVRKKVEKKCRGPPAAYASSGRRNPSKEEPSSEDEADYSHRWRSRVSPMHRRDRSGAGHRSSPVSLADESLQTSKHRYRVRSPMKSPSSPLVFRGDRHRHHKHRKH